MRFKVLAAALLGIAMGTTSANAVTTTVFDFAALADGAGGEGSWSSRGFAGNEWFPGGGTLGVIATGGVGGVGDAYLDKGNAGLGVCSTGFSASDQCIDSSDDNVTVTETLTLMFSEKVELADMLFRNQGHGLLNGSVIINAMLVTVASGAITAGYTAEFVTTYVFEWVDGSDFYISSVTAVPLPAGILLLLSGLGGLALIGRRRKSAAA